MTKDDITFQLGCRWAELLKKYFGRQNTAKAVARAFNVELRTAKGWLRGSTPYVKYIYVAGQKLGSGFVAELLTPNAKWKTYFDIDKELEKMELCICQLREEIRSLEKDVRHD